MVVRNRLLSVLSIDSLVASCVPFLLLACASGSANVHVGSSVDADTDVDSSATLQDDDEQSEDDDDDALSGSEETQTDGEDDGELEGEEPGRFHHERPGASLARAALHAATPAENHMGLVMAISERTSDLPWVLAIENRSPNPVTLAALPELLTAKVLPPPKTTEVDGESDVTTAAKTEAPEPVECASGSLPKSVSASETVELQPGQMLIHPFDLRDLCANEEILEEGATVELTYGFPIQTKKLWRGGKLTSVETEQTAPFVAERESATGEEIIPLKHLKADAVRLDQTYPLSKVSALPNEEDENESEKAAPPPLKLTISPLGTSSRPETGVVRVELRNTSGRTMKLFIRRELFTYEVSGPESEATCQMHPAERSPDPAAFATLSPGESRTLSTRLAEACPAGTWDAPGTYSVSAFFQATADGSEHGMSAFMGSAATQAPARLVVPGSESTRRRRMMVVPVEPPTPEDRKMGTKTD